MEQLILKKYVINRHLFFNTDTSKNCFKEISRTKKLDNSETDPCFLRNMLVYRNKGFSFFKWGVVNLFTYLEGESM